MSSGAAISDFSGKMIIRPKPVERFLPTAQETIQTINIIP
jgi:hypothetical protein